MGKTVKTRVRVITENTTITDQDFSGWLAINTGSGNVQVNKVVLQPREKLDFLTAIPSDCRWDDEIQIVILAGGGEVTLTQLLFKNK